MIVTSQGQLEELCTKLRAAGSFAFDTEFVRERTYFIRLGILQVATDETEAVLDPHAIESLSPLFELISDPGVEKVVHAGEQDFAIFYERTGEPPKNVFDTQIAAALLGFGDQLAYAKLVEKVVKVKLSKLETLTDWTARPLTQAQIDYALNDVRHLPELRRRLGNRLAEKGREQWAREEQRYLEDASIYCPTEPRQAYERIKAGGLDGRALGVLRELAAWREEEARRRDIPRGWVLRDQAMVEIARRKPGAIKNLRQVRTLKQQELARSGDAILTMVRRGLADPVSKEPAPVASARARARAKPLVRLLEAWLYARAAESEISPSMLSSREQIKELALGYLMGEIPTLPVLSGWRRELIGQDLLDILTGSIRLIVEPSSGKIKSLGPI
jgi:ribonuclease D